MSDKSRFAAPGALSPDVRPLPLEGFLEALPYMDKATRVFGSTDAAAEWFRTPARALSGQRPADLLSSDPQRVEALLTCLEASG